MAGIKPFILDELPTQLVPSGLYFIRHPLSSTQMEVHLASSDGTTTRCIYSASPIATMQPSLYDSVTVSYTGADLTSKKFYLDSAQVGELTYEYSGGDITVKKFYLMGVFVGKITYTYTAGAFTGSAYSTTE